MIIISILKFLTLTSLSRSAVKVVQLVRDLLLAAFCVVSPQFTELEANLFLLWISSSKEETQVPEGVEDWNSIEIYLS